MNTKNRHGAYTMKPSGTRQQLQVIENGLKLTYTSAIKYSCWVRKRLLCTHCTATHETEECPTVQPRWKRRVEEPTFGRLEEIPKGRKGICWDFNNGACRYGDKCRFCHICSECAGRHPRVSCQRASAPKKGLPRRLVDPLRSGLLNCEQRGTYACNITFSCKAYVVIITPCNS